MSICSLCHYDTRIHGCGTACKGPGSLWQSYNTIKTNNKLEEIIKAYPNFCFRCGDWRYLSTSGGSSIGVHYCKGYSLEDNKSIHPVINALMQALL